MSETRNPDLRIPVLYRVETYAGDKSYYVTVSGLPVSEHWTLRGAHRALNRRVKHAKRNGQNARDAGSRHHSIILG